MHVLKQVKNVIGVLEQAFDNCWRASERKTIVKLPDARMNKRTQSPLRNHFSNTFRPTSILLLLLLTVEIMKVELLSFNNLPILSTLSMINRSVRNRGRLLV